ncbi:hypothetical protein AAWM_07250 [Aspergillus awamori]|uniref:Uncharacterized protein n=1 Tax=Aspergillus awamori TaxID=105351 RepID=A0A401KYJ3_ASPAW|nr:hypothetical protein AAWM_07250 [Aspergillus awamori]
MWWKPSEMPDRGLLPIYSEASLRNFERDTVDNFVEKVIEALKDDERLHHEFGIQGRVTFHNRANPSETSLENSLEQLNLKDARTPQHWRTLGKEEAEESEEQPRRDRRGMALCEDAIGAPTTSACTLWRINGKYVFQAPHKSDGSPNWWRVYTR